MLPCLNKKLFGIECMGCGIQRATVLIFRGEFIAAFKMYPPIYTLLLLLLFLVSTFFIKFKYERIIKISLIAINLVIIVANFLFKMNAIIHS
ncbi:MAG: DUF2752 domain-containing protein [Flavobacteriaceae bacterium]